MKKFRVPCMSTYVARAVSRWALLHVFAARGPKQASEFSNDFVLHDSPPVEKRGLAEP
jgi:hypothetical protein